MDYHYIVVGGGAAGCMAAYRLSKKYPDKSIVILEINSNTLDDYKVDYSKELGWLNDHVTDHFNVKFNKTLNSF